MGIVCLFQYLKHRTKEVRIQEFCGKVAAVDASCWIHKALSISLSRHGTRDRFITIFEDYLKLLKETDVRQYVVFDGLKLPAKAREDERRQAERERRTQRAKAAAQTDLSNRLLAQAASITFEDIIECIKLCRLLDIQYVVSPYESDAQITYLVKNGQADFAITEDSDLLAYGCEKIVVKLHLNGKGEYFCLSNILKDLKVTKDQFLDCCITSGCDYLANVRGIGINKAFKMHLDATVDVFAELDAKGAPQGYREDFAKARAVFLHQTIFDTLQLKTKPISEWPSPPSQELQHYCGINLDTHFANELAVGNINIKTGTKNNSFPLLDKSRTPENQRDPSNRDHTGAVVLSNTEFVCEVTKLSDERLNWNIPCFPVMSLEFNKVTYQVNHQEFEGLIMTGQTCYLGLMRCKNQCSININGKQHSVLWDPSIWTTVEDDNCDTESETSDSECSEEEQTTEISHTLLFKVLGTCYCTTRQKTLEEAYDYIYEYNRPVFVKLQEEPENIHDPNAIAVFLKVSDSYNKVGYIARELTCYVSPCLSDPSFKAEVDRIRFRSTFLMVGFYLTIKLSKKGMWHNQVIKASRKVK